ncbi:MAG: TIGR01212 family radical SAM protein [Pirellulales bacterium]|nr:TIGR01212 family radical SAM protein [Pirellulales bacterium]
MRSRDSFSLTGGAADWRAAGLRYHSLNHFFTGKFGRRVWKVSIDGRFGCPNADGTVATGGCIFCNIRSFSPSRRLRTASITEQLAQGTQRLEQRHGVDHFIAYFQPATNTYAPVDRLRSLWEEAVGFPGVVGLAVGTRPDCVPDEVLDLLEAFSARTWVCVEYGLQTIHDRWLDWMNRGHHYDAFLDAVERTRRRGIDIGAHVILGLPGQTREEILATAREVARLRLHSVKLHNLYAVRNTPLADQVLAGEVVLPQRDEYVGYVADFLELLPPECVIDRLSGEAPPEYLVAPQWCLDKQAVRSAIEKELKRRDSWQGKRFDLST